MDLSPTMLIVALVGGTIAGIINTLAGSGSLVTLPILVFLGLPAHIANGTNRVGILIQSAVGVATFKKQGALELKGTGWFLVPALIGASIGALVATDIGEAATNLTIGILMVIMFVLTLIEPKKWLREVSERTQGRPPTWLLLVFVVIGFHGGFLQAGVGVTLLVGLVLGAGFSLVEANGVKMMIAFCFSGVRAADGSGTGARSIPRGALPLEQTRGRGVGTAVAARGHSYWHRPLPDHADLSIPRRFMSRPPHKHARVSPLRSP